MPVIVNNRIPELSELSARLESFNKDSGEAAVRYNLVLGQAEIRGDDGHSWQVSMKAAYVKLHPSGMEIDPLKKYGKLSKGPIPITTKVIKEGETKKTTSFNGEASIGAKGIDATTGINLERGSQQVERITSEFTNSGELLPVVAKGDDTWLVKCLAEKFLDGTYLDDVMLCTIKAKPRANRSAVTAFVMARQRDLQFEIVPEPGIYGTIDKLKNLGQSGKKRIFDILLAKGLNRVAEDETNKIFDSSVVLSSVELTVEVSDA